MTQARSQLVNAEITPYYLVTASCVRQSYLCGHCHLTGHNYEHRKRWVTERLALLSEVFAIEVAAYAVMSNHYHLVVRIETERAWQWSDEEVIARWGRLFRLPAVIETARQVGAPEALQAEVSALVYTWRERLMSLSWLMRCLNEYLARRANDEDGCRGRFWEGRFKSKALLDEGAVLMAMAYVDLNPVRAQRAKTLATSSHTSIEQRLKRATGERLECAVRLMPLTDSANAVGSVTVSWVDYVAFVDWSGRHLHPEKRGVITEGAPPLLARMNLQAEGVLDWLGETTDMQGLSVLGYSHSLVAYRTHRQLSFVKGKSLSERLYYC